MKVGVIAGRRTETEGGNYSITEEIVEALVSGELTEEIVVMFDKKRGRAKKGQTKAGRGWAGWELASPSAVGRARLLAECLFPELRFVLPIRNWYDAEARRRGIGAYWFINRLRDTCDTPYITMVCDLMHRTHPWFPEVSANGRWEFREKAFQRHLRRASGIIVGTETGKQEIMKAYGIPEDRFILAPHPTPSFALRAAKKVAPADERERFFLYPAQFWPHKNHVNLVRAWVKVKERTTEPPKLILVGSDKGNRRYVEAEIAVSGVSDLVEVRGFVRREELVELYARAMGLIFVPFTGPENLPPLEAFALGCPVVAARWPGAEEQLGDAALLVDPRSPEAIADAVCRVLEDRELRRALVSRGRSRAQSRTAAAFISRVFEFLRAFETARRCWP